MPGSCAECEGASAPSTPRQKAAGVSGGEGAGGEALAPGHLQAHRAHTQAQLRKAGVILRNTVVAGMKAYIPSTSTALTMCVSQSMWHCDSGFGESSSHRHLTANGFPNLTFFGLAKAVAVS